MSICNARPTFDGVLPLLHSCLVSLFVWERIEVNTRKEKLNFLFQLRVRKHASPRRTSKPLSIAALSL